MQTIKLLGLHSCNACQNACEHCAHKGMRDDEPAHQMGLDGVTALIDHLKRIDCRIRILSLGGPGEPLLWRHFNEAVRMLHAAGIADEIETTTNGRRLQIIAEDVWGMLARVQISVYGYPLDGSIINRHQQNIRMLPRTSFWYIHPDTPPSPHCPNCCCPGPMYYKGRIFPHCGPVLFDAAKRANVDPFGFSIPLEQWNPSNQPAMPTMPCGWCWGNPSVPKITVNEFWRDGNS